MLEIIIAIIGGAFLTLIVGMKIGRKKEKPPVVVPQNDFKEDVEDLQTELEKDLNEAHEEASSIDSVGIDDINAELERLRTRGDKRR